MVWKKEFKTRSQEVASSGSSLSKSVILDKLETSGLPHLRNDGIGLDDIKNSCQIKSILRAPWISKSNN